jgi:TonB family protein
VKLHILFLVLASILRGADSESWCPAKLQSLDYPTLALQARISGTVHLELRVASDGSVGTVRIITGNHILALAAQENAKGWKFMRCVLQGTDATRQDNDIQFVYDFKLVGETKSAPKTEFSYEHPNRVTITSAAPHWMP